MSRFHIAEVGAGERLAGWLPLKLVDGVNIISGPSNHGKSTVLRCIAFVLGAPALPQAVVERELEVVYLRLEDGEKGWITLERAIVSGKKKSTGARKVHVESNLPHIYTGDYAVRGGGYSTLLLSLFGIKGPRKLVMNAGWETRPLEFWQLLAFIYIDENRIMDVGRSPLWPRESNEVLTLTILWLLLTGDDLKEALPPKNGGDLRKRIREREADISYLRRKYATLIDGESTDTVFPTEDDLLARMAEILKEGEAVEAKLQAASTRNQALLKEMVAVNMALETQCLSVDQFEKLRTRYQSDYDRMAFLAQGQYQGQLSLVLEKCPVCGGPLMAEAGDLSATQKEMARLTAKLSDLDETLGSLRGQMAQLTGQQDALVAEQAAVADLIATRLTPRAADLSLRLERYRALLKARMDRYAQDTERAKVAAEIEALERETDAPIPPFDPRELYKWEAWKALDAAITPLVADSGYPGAREVRLSLSDLDLVVGGKPRAGEGEGYGAFLATLLLFGLMKHLGEAGAYAPHLLMVDSPIKALKEAPGDAVGTAEGMKAGLFRTLLAGCGDNQIIIVENELPEGVDYSGVNRITFGEAGGWDGFLVQDML